MLLSFQIQQFQAREEKIREELIEGSPGILLVFFKNRSGRLSTFKSSIAIISIGLLVKANSVKVIAFGLRLLFGLKT